MATPTPTKKGLTTIVWGTNNVCQSPAGMIWESIAITPKNGEAIGEIENGDGASVSLVFLADGFRARLTGVLDTNVALPADYANCTLRLPVSGGNTITSKDYTCTIESVVPSYSRKAEAKLEIGVVYRPGIHGDPANVA